MKLVLFFFFFWFVWLLLLLLMLLYKCLYHCNIIPIIEQIKQTHQSLTGANEVNHSNRYIIIESERERENHWERMRDLRIFFILLFDTLLTLSVYKTKWQSKRFVVFFFIIIIIRRYLKVVLCVCVCVWSPYKALDCYNFFSEKNGLWCEMWKDFMHDEAILYQFSLLVTHTHTQKRILNR